MSTTESETQQLSRTADVSTAVVMAVADAIDVSPYEIQPLYDAIDPDALNELFQPRGDGRPRTGLQVTFELAGCTVDIQDGAILVVPNSASPSERSDSRPAQVS